MSVQAFAVASGLVAVLVLAGTMSNYYTSIGYHYVQYPSWIFENVMWMVEYIICLCSAWVRDNALLQTALVGSAVSTIAYVFAGIIKLIYTRVNSFFLSSITIKNTDPNYYAVVDYITEKYLLHDQWVRYSMQVLLYNTCTYVHII